MFVLVLGENLLFPSWAIVYTEIHRSTERRFLGHVQKGHYLSEGWHLGSVESEMQIGVRWERSLKEQKQPSGCQRFAVFTVFLSFRFENSLGNVTS